MLNERTDLREEIEKYWKGKESSNIGLQYLKSDEILRNFQPTDSRYEWWQKVQSEIMMNEGMEVCRLVSQKEGDDDYAEIVKAVDAEQQYWDDPECDDQRRFDKLEQEIYAAQDLEYLEYDMG